MRKLLALTLLSAGLVWAPGPAASVAGDAQTMAPVEQVETKPVSDRDNEPVKLPYEDPNTTCIAPSTMCYPGQKENRDISTGCCYFTCSDQREYVLTAFTPGVPCP